MLCEEGSFFEEINCEKDSRTLKKWQREKEIMGWILLVSAVFFSNAVILSSSCITVQYTVSSSFGQRFRFIQRESLDYPDSDK